jgi:eukaryotic-like serine/threonine-protein kinase
VLYEMATGRQAFTGNTAGVITEAILNRAPAPPTRVNPDLPGEFEIILAKTLEKDREMRCQTAAELRADLKRLKRETESGRSRIGSGFSSAAQKESPEPATSSKRSWMPVAIATGVALVAGLAGGIFVATRQKPISQPVYHQVTFRRGTVFGGRFGPDSQTIYYTAAWDGNPAEIYSTRTGSPESASLGHAGTQLLGVSSTSEMVLLLNSRTGLFQQFGTLARTPIAGGAPREVLNDVNWADWTTDGSSLAIVRLQGGFSQLEFPIGKVLYKTPGWIGDPRISPKGDRIAFLEHPIVADDGGSVDIVDLTGAHKTLATNWISEDGLAWSPKGDEIWFTGTHEGVGRALYAVDLSGKERLLARVPGTLTILDTARDGRVLLRRDAGRQEIKGFIDGDTKGESCHGSTFRWLPDCPQTERRCYSPKWEKQAALPTGFTFEERTALQRCGLATEIRNSSHRMANGCSRSLIPHRSNCSCCRPKPASHARLQMMPSTTLLRHGFRMENKWSSPEASPDTALGSTCKIW